MSLTQSGIVHFTHRVAVVIADDLRTHVQLSDAPVVARNLQITAEPNDDRNRLTLFVFGKQICATDRSLAQHLAVGIRADGEGELIRQLVDFGREQETEVPHYASSECETITHITCQLCVTQRNLLQEQFTEELIATGAAVPLHG